MSWANNCVQTRQGKAIVPGNILFGLFELVLMTFLHNSGFMFTIGLKSKVRIV
jgi:hypothetical protein